MEKKKKNCPPNNTGGDPVDERTCVYLPAATVPDSEDRGKLHRFDA